MLSFVRKDTHPDGKILIVCNFTPVPRHNYRLGVPQGGVWAEILNSDAKDYGGSGQGNMGGVRAEARPWHGRSHSVCLRLPPLSVVVFKPESGKPSLYGAR